MSTDHVEHILKQWNRECPDLDTRSMAVVGRILRSANLLQQHLQKISDHYDLPQRGFDVLASLRRQGSPFQLSPTQLYKELLLTSGAITYRLDRLEELGLIERISDPDDRRGMLVRLTLKGREQVDQYLDDHTKKEQNILDSLSKQEQENIVQGLSKLLVSLETYVG